MKYELVPYVVGLVAAVGLAAAAFAQAAPDSTTQPADPAPGFIAEMDAAPADERPPNWDHVKKLMTRKPPAVGDPAPDFTLKTQDGRSEITRSKHMPGRPQVIIFGSFT